MKKRVLSFVMAMLMVFSLMPVSVFATETEAPAACAVEGCIVLGEHTEHMYADAGDTTAADAGDATDADAGDTTDADAGDTTDADAGDSTDADAGDTTDADAGDTADADAGDTADADAGDTTDADAGDTTDADAGDTTDANAGDTTDAAVCAENCILAEGHEGDCYVCEAGCILSGEAEHAENGWECFVWIPCALTEGCELADGHEGDCTGASTFDANQVTISGSTYYGKYVVISDGTDSDLYYVSSTGVVQTTDGETATFANGSYTVYYGIFSNSSGRGNGDSSFANGTFTVSDNSNSVTVRMSSTSVSNSNSNVYLYATSLFYNTTAFSHVDVRVAGSYVINVGNQTYTATVSNPIVVVKVGGSTVASQNWTGDTSETYEWRQTELSLTKASTITVELTLDLTYTDSTGTTHTLEDVQITYDSKNNVDKFIDAIAICDMVQGLDFRVSVEDIQEELADYNVIYQWKVYNLDGTWSDSLPASLGAHGLPASVTVSEGTDYVYNTGYVEGTSYYDYENGLLYTFHGWDTWSHNSTWNVDATAEGYHALDDGDTDATNNQTIEITADTWINGYWTVSELPPSDAYLMVKKVVVVEGGDADYVTNYLQNTGKMYISIDPGIDQDGDDAAQVDVDYGAAVTDTGYRIDVYQYDTPFIFDEYQMEVPGYTRTTVISTSGENLSLVTEDGTTVSGTHAVVDIQEEYDPTYEPYNLGTVTYTNTYTRNEGAAVSEYPSLTLLKTAADTQANQAGVVFTLYKDAACTEAAGTYTTDANGYAHIDFTGMAAGTYYLKETAAAPGYVADESVYTVTLTASDPVEEMRWNETDGKYEYVRVTYYTLSVTVPDGSTASYTETRATNVYYRLHVYNSPILGELNLSKTIEGIAEADKANVNAVVIVHGPITRDDAGNITDIGSTWQLELNSENGWKAALGELYIGEYLIHESFASVHGYTWTGVTYGDLETTVYNGITSGVFEVEDETAIELTLTNNYEEWTAADFYIKKVSDTNAALAGAEFTLSTDMNGANVVTTATTGADGYAHFDGFKVPEGQDSVVYYLKETEAPAGYYLDDTVYKVEIKAVTDSATNKTTYEAKISVKNESDEWVEFSAFNNDTDLLTVTNNPILGQLTITKKFGSDVMPAASVDVNISGPGYSNAVTLNDVNKWTVVLQDLPLGEYTITETNASVPGYDLDVRYEVNDVETNKVVLSEEEPGYTVDVADEYEVTGSATITNTYTRNDEYYEVPTTLTVLKVDDSAEAQPLAGATFTLTGDNYSKTYTTGADGKVVFDLLFGSLQSESVLGADNGKKVYTLTEVTAPTGYVKSQETWEIVVVEDNGQLRVELNENKNVFENFWDWILNKGNSNYVWNDEGYLTVTNTKVTGQLTISKREVNVDGDFTYTDKDGNAYVKVNISGPNYNETVNVPVDGTEVTIENLELGEYSVTEETLDMTDTGYTYSVSMVDSDGTKIAGTNIDGEVLLDISEHTDYVVSAQVDITNTYTKVTGEDNHIYPDFKVYKTDDQRKALEGATFQLAGANLSQNLVVTTDAYGMITFEGLKPGTYTLTEVSAPDGYAKDNGVYQVVVSVKDGYPVEQLVNGKHIMHYEYVIAVTNGDEDVTINNNTLTVVNPKVSGALTITKAFGDDNAYVPRAIYVKVTGPNGYSAEVTLNATNNWTVTLTGLALGNYVVSEKDASISGYTLRTFIRDTDGNVTYGNSSDGRVTLAVGDLEAGFTTAVVSASVAITNTYVKNTVVPAYDYPELTVYKLRTGTTDVMLKDATFMLVKIKDENGNDLTNQSTTGRRWTAVSDENGKLVFENLNPGTYLLREIKAPEGYAITENVYTIVVEKVSETGEVLQADGTWLNTYTYDIKEITDTNDAVEVRFVDDTNTLAVFNDKSTGSLTIKKEFGQVVNGVNSSDITAENFADYDAKILVTVAAAFPFDKATLNSTTGKYELVIELNAANDWTAVLENIPVGEYIVTEDQEAAEIDGHNLYVATNPNMVDGKVSVTLTKDNENRYATFNNTYSTHIPASLDVKKVDASGNVLAGAVFGIYSDASCSDASLIATRTTRQDGIATFPGFTTVGKTYYLKEISAPANYDKVDTVWKIEVSRDEGEEQTILTVTEGETILNSGESGVLTITVANTRSLGDLVISKTVRYVDGSGNAVDSTNLPDTYKPKFYKFKVTILDDNNAYWIDEDITYNAYVVEVPADGSFEIEDIPYGYTYSVQEVTTGAVFTSVVTNGSGKIAANEVAVSAENTYTIDTETPGLNIVKHENGTAKVIAGAEFALFADKACKEQIGGAVFSDADGRLNLPLTSVGTFYLKEVAPAEGYHPNDTVYTITTKYVYENDTVNKTVKQIVVVDSTKWADYSTMKLTNPKADPADYEFHVVNTPIKPVIISVEKVWNDDNYYARPDHIDVYLYMDDKSTEDEDWHIYDATPVVLNEENNWRYVWNGGIAAGLTDEYNWKVEEAVSDEMAVEYVSNADDSDKDNHWIITNTRSPRAIELTVEKKWIDNNDTSYKPESIKVQLFRDDVAYGNPVELKENEDGKWLYTWTTAADPNINDAHVWTVKELVPDGYEAVYGDAIYVEGENSVLNGTLTITNTRIIRDLELTVNKVWENIPDGYEIPETLEVVLMKDGEILEGETKTLRADSEPAWTATWAELKDGTKLTDDHVWSVAEVIDSKLYEASWSKPVYETKVVDGKTIVTQAVTITNTLKWEEIDVHVTKVWDVPDGYTAIPESVEVQLYRNGEKYGDVVKLSEDNKWTYSWTDLPDCFKWEVKEVTVPRGYTAEVVSDAAGANWTIINTLDYKEINVSVSKVWLNPTGYTKQPTSVAVVLYRDGKAYDTVTLSESNGWHYKWTDLEDCFTWTVDEPNVPTDYSKKITHIGNAWVITNAHKDIPLTGDDSNILLWAGATGVAVVGLGASLIMLLKKRKEEDEQA